MIKSVLDICDSNRIYMYLCSHSASVEIDNVIFRKEMVKIGMNLTTHAN